MPQWTLFKYSVSRRIEIEEKCFDVEERFSDLEKQLKSVQEENEKLILEREIEKLLLRKEEKLEIRWKDEENTCLEEVGGKEGLVGDRSLHLDRSLALEMDCDWEVRDAPPPKKRENGGILKKTGGGVYPNPTSIFYCF